MNGRHVSGDYDKDYRFIVNSKIFGNPGERFLESSDEQSSGSTLMILGL